MEDNIKCELISKGSPRHLNTFSLLILCTCTASFDAALKMLEENIIAYCGVDTDRRIHC